MSQEQQPVEKMVIEAAAAVLAPAAPAAPDATSPAAPAGRHFLMPEIRSCAAGWGPCFLPSSFTDVPYQPFSKGDKLGRAADWNAAAAGPGAGRGYGYQGRQSAAATKDNAFFFKHEAEDETFHVVEAKGTTSKGSSSRRGKIGGPGGRGRGGAWAPRPAFQPSTRGGRGGFAGGRGGRVGRDGRPFQSQRWGLDGRNVSAQVLATSVEVRPEWKVREQFEFSALQKLGADIPAEPTDLIQCGVLYPLGRKFEKINVRQELPLERSERAFYSVVTTTDDPIIRQLSMEEQSAPQTVYATDAILAALMTAPRSLYPWDVVVVRMGPLTFLDKRPNCPLDDMTVSETANEPPSNDADVANSPHALGQEATYINQMYSQQALAFDGTPRKFDRPLPFETEESEAAPVAFRYRRWMLDENIALVARCEVNAYNEAAGPDAFVRVQAFNEWDLKSTDWRKRLDTQRGAVLATELKNNSAKLARWTMQALLSGAQDVHLGYVSRKHPKDTFNHVVLGTQSYKTKDFAVQINLGLKNAWAILKKIVGACTALPDGRYLVVKDPMKPVLRIFEAPDDQADSEVKDQQVVLE